MQIGTNNYISSLIGSLAQFTSGTASTRAQSAQPASGTDYLLSLGQNAGTSSDAGLYSSLLPALQSNSASQPMIWRFNPSILQQMPPVIGTEALSPQEQKQHEEALKKAFDLIDAKQYNKARALVGEMLEENPQDAAAAHALGTVEMSEGNYEDAEQMFLRAHAYNSTVGYDNDAANARLMQEDDDTVYQRASAMVASPIRRDDGIRVLIALTERSPEHVNGHLALGDAMLATGDAANGLMQYNAAVVHADSSEAQGIEKRLEALVERHPESAFVQQLIGKSQLKQERYDDALLSLQRAAELGDHHPAYSRDLASAHVGIGRGKLDRGDLNGALAAFERAKELNPSGVDVNEALAQGYLERAEKNVARRAHSAALADYQKAADALEKSADKSLKSRASHGVYALGRKLEDQRAAAGEDIDQEVTAYQLAYDLDDENKVYRNKLAETRSALGDQLLAAGETREAAYSYKRAWQLDQNNDDYRDAAISAFVAHADDRLYNLNYDDAVEAYREAYRMDTDNTETKSKLAGAYNARGLDHKSWERWSQAADDFEEALHLFPDNAEYQSNYNSVSAWDD